VLQKSLLPDLWANQPIYLSKALLLNLIAPCLLLSIIVFLAAAGLGALVLMCLPENKWKQRIENAGLGVLATLLVLATVGSAVLISVAFWVNLACVLNLRTIKHAEVSGGAYTSHIGPAFWMSFGAMVSWESGTKWLSCVLTRRSLLGVRCRFSAITTRTGRQFDSSSSPPRSPLSWRIRAPSPDSFLVFSLIIGLHNHLCNAVDWTRQL
jgi:hypothetical protein